MAGDPEEIDPDKLNPDPDDEVEDQEPGGADESDELDEDESESEQPDGEVPGAQAKDRQEEVQPSRRERRITAQQDALKERDRKIADLEGRLNGYIAQQTNNQPRETQEQREQRLALLDPVDRLRVEMQEERQASTRTMQNMQFTLMDSSDKATFDAKSLVDPLYAKWGPKVEAFISELRGKGQNVAREQALKYLIGEAALSGRKAQTGKQRQEAASRVARNRVQPGNSRSDTQANRRQGSGPDALERRLENVEI